MKLSTSKSDLFRTQQIWDKSSPELIERTSQQATVATFAVLPCLGTIAIDFSRFSKWNQAENACE